MQQISGFRHSASKPDILSILDVLVNLADGIIQLLYEGLQGEIAIA